MAVAGTSQGLLSELGSGDWEVCFLPVGSFCEVKNKWLVIKVKGFVKVGSLAPSAVDKWYLFFFEGISGCIALGCVREGREAEAETGKKRGYACGPAVRLMRLSGGRPL